MRARTAAQWRREVPAYDQAWTSVEILRVRWPGAGRIPHMVAHIHPDSRVVSIVLHGTADECDAADRRLLREFPQATWRLIPDLDRQAWRKVVSR